MDEDIVRHIDELVAEEHELHSRRTSGAVPAEDQHRLEALEVQLDQCWDLLRQRRARRAAGQDPEDAASRPPQVVEGYQQ
ncbi:MAG: hypothetical protein JWM05_3455 [Acidimicrobiales bacterium]|nr:hypothetical protein [Acidimicrobiales bacterium]